MTNDTEWEDYEAPDDSDVVVRFEGGCQCEASHSNATDCDNWTPVKMCLYQRGEDEPFICGRTVDLPVK